MKKNIAKIEKTITLLELTNVIMDVEKALKSLHPYYNQESIINDYRSENVKKGDYTIYCKGQLCKMDIFHGVVVKTLKNSQWPTRIWVEIRLKHNKYVSFFVDNNGDIKKGIYIEVIGICYKKDNYYNIYARGGYRRILSPDELNQLSNGIPFDDLKTNVIPEMLLSERKLTAPVEKIKLVKTV